MRRELDSILEAARTIEREKLPRLLGDLEEIRATAAARLAAPPEQKPPDENLNVDECAARMHVSRSFLYRNHARYKFARKEGSRLLFSASGLAEHLAAQSKC